MNELSDQLINIISAQSSRYQTISCLYKHSSFPCHHVF